MSYVDNGPEKVLFTVDFLKVSIGIQNKHYIKCIKLPD